MTHPAPLFPCHQNPEQAGLVCPGRDLNRATAPAKATADHHHLVRPHHRRQDMAATATGATHVGHDRRYCPSTGRHHAPAHTLASRSGWDGAGSGGPSHRGRHSH
jgi:hypothetical protein